VTDERSSPFDHVDRLGTHATVFVDGELGEPLWIGDDEELRQELRDLVGPTDDFNIVSVYTLHVALYALQNPTPENVRKALYLIGTSGDCEEATDEETLLPLPVPPPHGWEKAWIPEELR
jgi:hypothetical protein